jgi:hypothetical protein
MLSMCWSVRVQISLLTSNMRLRRNLCSSSTDESCWCAGTRAPRFRFVQGSHYHFPASRMLRSFRITCGAVHVFSLDKLRGAGKRKKKAHEAFNGGWFRSGGVVAQPNHREASITRTISELRGLKTIPTATQSRPTQEIFTDVSVEYAAFLFRVFD